MTGDYRTDDLIAAPATPRGRGALAVVRTSGFGCIDSISGFFSRPKALTESAGGRIHHGWILDGEGHRIDEVLISVFRAPASYTGQDSVEISCHGGFVVIDRIMDVLRDSGFRDAAPGEFTFRAFASGKMDLMRAEAVREIIESRTDRARALAVGRLSGSVVRVVDKVKETVRHQAATASLALDYPEDEAEPVPFDISAITGAKDALFGILGTWNTGRLYRDGLLVAFAGPANAGKSSLFNLFLKEERSIVTDTPGTTRDWVEAWVNMDGIPVRLADTAGLRTGTADAIEAEGMKRTRDLIAGSDLIVAVADSTAGVDAALVLEREELAVLGTEAEARLIRVWNKSDLVADAPEGWIPVSAVTGAGFKDLEASIMSVALHGGASPEADAPVIDSVRQKTLLEQAAEALERFLDGADRLDETPMDLLAEDLNDALESLGELTGEVTRTDVLETLFSEFCVGK